MLLLAVVVVALPSPVAATDAPGSNGDYVDRRRKAALVVGLAAYARATPLPNAVSDARLIAERLKAAGFSVVESIDRTRAELVRDIERFREQVRGADVAVTYFAGHAVQVEGENYIVPIEFDLDGAARDPLRDLVSISDHLKAVGKLSRAQVLVLDACRDNPFVATLGKRLAGRAVAAGIGPVELPLVERVGADKSPRGLIVAYATQPGHFAEDGFGRNGPYATALARALERPDESLQSILQRTAALVSTETHGRQHPEARDALTAPVYLLLHAAPLSCDVLAAEEDNNISIRGVAFDDIVAERALPACRADVARFPGNLRLRHNLARVLDRMGSDRDAVQIYRELADVGFDWSQNNLGAMLILGEGVERDVAEGIGWLKKAAAQGNRQAIQTYTEVDLSEVFVDAPGRTRVLQEALAERTASAVAVSGQLDQGTQLGIQRLKRDAGIGQDGVTLEVLDVLGIAVKVLSREKKQ